ncbi:type III secretion system export apparatus subunit SctR [Caldimonas brevitalea]|uniref:Type III secretion system protein SsaR n=1 Tax=Caldimonas brevitalea TaxID=413882 RepID=A0A0G3BEJ2_9BURK|nr:type III secretion system export apparatus subunit SctR [Caldimonas brevitalea]AKJ27814.1 type III secretion system protein SsaR [Caldimonas brevitalea]
MNPTAQPIEVLPLIVIAFAVGLLPFTAMMVTSYTKIVVVLGLLRNALGVQQVPPNMVINGLALIISGYIMAPLAMDSYDQMLRQGIGSSASQQVGQVFNVAREPVRKFLDKHAHEREKAFFLKSAGAVWPAERAKELKKDDLIVLAPAFTLSELTEAFKIGFLLYIAFVVVDLIIANVLLALGLSQVSPTQLSIPFKLLLFVVLDGWSTLMHGLVLTYR